MVVASTTIDHKVVDTNLFWLLLCFFFWLWWFVAVVVKCGSMLDTEVDGGCLEALVVLRTTLVVFVFVAAASFHRLDLLLLVVTVAPVVVVHSRLLGVDVIFLWVSSVMAWRRDKYMWTMPWKILTMRRTGRRQDRL